MLSSLAEDQLIPVRIFYRYLIRLIAARPDHQICILQVLGLFLSRAGLNTLDSLLRACSYLVVKLPGVASESGVGVKEAVGVCKYVLVELRVTVLLGHFDSVVKHPDLVSVQDFDASIRPILHEIVFVIEVPVFVMEVPEAEALAVAGLVLGLLLRVVAVAALLAVVQLLERSIRHLLVRFVVD